MIKQKSVVIKTALATLTYAEMGDIVCNSATDITITLPAPNSGLWYRISNVGVGIVTLYYGSVLTTLKQTEQCLCLANASTDWFFSKGGGEMTQAEIEAVLTGTITSHTHDFTGLSDVPANYVSAGSRFVKVNADATGLEFVVGEVIASSFTDLTDVPGSYVGNAEKIVAVNVTENALEFIDAPSGGGLVINPNHIFTDNIARDNYFTTNPTEKVTGIYISVGTDFQQWDGTVWLDKTAVITGVPGADGVPGTDGVGVPLGGTAGQVLSKIDGTDNNTEWKIVNAAKLLDKAIVVADFVGKDGYILAYDEAGGTFYLKIDEAGGGGLIQAFLGKDWDPQVFTVVLFDSGITPAY